MVTDPQCLHMVSNVPTVATGVWYGIPIYLLEFAPITVFYFLILAFILHSQLVTLFLQSFETFQPSIEYEQGVVMYILFQLVTVFYGVWNLDFVIHTAAILYLTSS